MVLLFAKEAQRVYAFAQQAEILRAKKLHHDEVIPYSQQHRASELTTPLLLMIGAFLFFPLRNAFSQDMRMHSGLPLQQLQQELEEEYGYLPMEEFHMMSKELGLPTSDLRLRALFHPDARQEYLRKKKAQEDPVKQEPSTTSQKLFAHVIKGSGGKPVITKEEIMEPHLKFLRENKEKALQIAMEKIKEGQKAAREQFTIPPLPSCLLSYTDKTELSQKVDGRESAVIGDFLFVGPKHITTNSKEIFGESVHLIVYDSSKPSPFGLLAKNYQVSCLPYRIRSTGTFLFKHYGEHALRNFNGDPHGDGEKLL